jgi:hypothetical protein
VHGLVKSLFEFLKRLVDDSSSQHRTAGSHDDEKGYRVRTRLNLRSSTAVEKTMKENLLGVPFHGFLDSREDHKILCNPILI